MVDGRLDAGQVATFGYRVVTDSEATAMEGTFYSLARRAHDVLFEAEFLAPQAAPLRVTRAPTPRSPSPRCGWTIAIASSWRSPASDRAPSDCGGPGVPRTASTTTSMAALMKADGRADRI